MGHTVIKKGLNIPISGAPSSELTTDLISDHIALMALDFNGMKPKMLCKVDQTVKRGEPLFEDRKNPGVIHTSAGAGKIIAINRGARRVLQSIVIELEENDMKSNGDIVDADIYQNFEHFKGENQEYSGEELEDLLIESGMWTRIRRRPFSMIPQPKTRPGALFITCTETEPLAPPISAQLGERGDDFKAGAEALTKMMSEHNVPTYICTEPSSSVPSVSGATNHSFSGLHPAGLPGTHIHFLYPVTRKRIAWYIHLQDVIAIGALIRTGKLDTSRIISLGGPAAENPRLIKTRIGAKVQILTGPTDTTEFRNISGSCISGRIANDDIHGYMGLFHRQVTQLKEGREQEFIGWMLPGGNKFSSIPAFISSLFGPKVFNFTTTTNGEHRDMVPIGMYERIMPLDIIPTFLLRAMEEGHGKYRDTDRAEKLGALELDEEDLALCSFVCPGKQDHGVNLRQTLDEIWKEG